MMLTRALSLGACLCLPLLTLAAERDVRAARKLLEGAAEMASSVHPETSVAALMRAGMALGSVDREAGLELLRRAFQALPGSVSEDLREEYATAIVRGAADVDIPAATELLLQTPKPAAATTAVVRQLIAGKRYDETMELLALLPEKAEYPFEAASWLIASLPKDDPRRTVSFGRAISAYSRLAVGPFPVMVERFGAEMPADLRRRAVSAMLARIAQWKDGGESVSADAKDDGGKWEYHTPEQTELRELLSVVRMFDAAAADRITEQRPDIRAALAGFGKPRKASEPLRADAPQQPDEDDEAFLPPFGIGMAKSIDDFHGRLDEFEKSVSEAQKARKVFSKDPAEAVRIARTLPESIRAETLGYIASELAAKDAGAAQPVLDACVAEIEQLSSPATRVSALIRAGQTYSRLNNAGRAFAAFERAFSDAGSLWAADARADRPNVASRDTWPSTQAARTIAHEAALRLGASAEGLLQGIGVPDLALLARIQMARGLLGLPADVHRINVRWIEKEK